MPQQIALCKFLTEHILVAGNAGDHQPQVLQHTFLQHHSADEVRFTGILAFLTGGGANKVILPRLVVVAGAVIQLSTAVRTARNAGEHVTLAGSRGTSLVLANLLHTGEGICVDDRLMGILEDMPFLRRILDLLLTLVGRLPRFEIDHVTEVFQLTENA